MNTQSLSPGAKVVPANKLGPPWGPHRHVHCGHCPWPGCWEVLGTLPLHPLSYPEQTHLQCRGPPGKAQGARLLQQHTGVAPRPVTQSPTADWTPRSLRGTGSTHGWPWPNFTGRASGSVGSESWAGGGPSLGRRGSAPRQRPHLPPVSRGCLPHPAGLPGCPALLQGIFPNQSSNSGIEPWSPAL